MITESPFRTPIYTTKVSFPEIVEDFNLVVPVKRHRKKRINKKYLKRYGSKPDSKSYKFGNILVMHPETLRRVQVKLSNAAEKMSHQLEAKMIGGFLK